MSRRDQGAVPRVHEGCRGLCLRRVLRQRRVRSTDQSRDRRDHPRAARSGVSVSRPADHLHVVRHAERRGGRVGAGVLTPRPVGLDPALLRSIALRVGTPAYVYSAGLIRAQYHALEDALREVPHRIHYAIKANGNLGVLRVLRHLGAGADIVSLGELERARRAGFDPAKIVFSGVGKTAEELDAAIGAGVGQINVESPSELDALIAAARRVGTPATVGIRVNPDVAT